MLAFDTYQYVKKLQSVGFTEQQAEVQSNALKTIIENDLATKLDIKELEAKIESLRLASKSDLKELEAKIESLRLASKSDLKELEIKLEAKIESIASCSWMILG